MNTTALRLYGEDDLRLESFSLPEPGDDEILAEVVSDSLCMSSYKAAKQGVKHARVPENVATAPVMVGHEFSVKLLKVGSKWAHRYQEGAPYGIQPALLHRGTLDAPGYSFPYIGGDATYVLIPSCVMKMGCLLDYTGAGYFRASLAEPLSCVIGAARASYHVPVGSHEHQPGIVEGGRAAILAGAGPMGLAMISLLIYGPRRPSVLLVTDIDQARLDRAATVLPVQAAADNGVQLIYQNTASEAAAQTVRQESAGTFDDVFVFAAIESLIEQADSLLARGGCLNFFAGPTDTDFSAPLNLYNVHYRGTHIVGTSGGNTEDMRLALEWISDGTIDPAILVTHVGGLTAARDATMKLPTLPGGKKLLYTHFDMPLVAIEDFAKRGEQAPFYAALAEICDRHRGLWSLEAEHYVLAHGPRLKP